MPIYEFYCPDCHTVFSFLSATVNTRKRPACPRCRRPRLQRRPSRFAISRSSGKGDPAAGDLPDTDPQRLESGLAALAREAEGLDENDPRQMARLVRKLYDSSGLDLGEGMTEAVRRMEAGQDPDAIEEEMGDLLANPEILPAGSRGRLRRALLPLQVDDTLHRL